MHSYKTKQLLVNQYLVKGTDNKKKVLNSFLFIWLVDIQILS